jgi:hypothetical protein
MDNFEIIKGFRDIYDINRLKINIDDILLKDNYISFLKDNNLKGLTIYSSDKRYSIIFSFLENVPFIEYLELLVPLSKKSDISGLYSLSKLKYLRWISENSFELDFSKLATLNVLVTSDYGGMKNWNSLIKLKKLHISKLNKDNCSFISNLKELTDLRLNRANITSIEGLENCVNLERIELLNCLKISELSSVLANCSSVRSISIIKCKNIKEDEIERIRNTGKSLWIE